MPSSPSSRACAAARPAAPGEDGEIERQLLALCEGELEGRKLEVDESLFDIGASSLKLIAIHERIERRWPGLIELPDIFEHPSVRELAVLIDAQARERGGVESASHGSRAIRPHAQPFWPALCGRPTYW